MKPTLPAMVVELKWNKSSNGAIEQIEKNEYPQILRGYGNEILLVGINYDARTKVHSCEIKRLGAT